MAVNIGVANLEGQLTRHAQNDGEPVNGSRPVVCHRAAAFGR